MRKTNAISVKQYEQYKGKLFNVRVFDRFNTFNVIDYNDNPMGLTEAYEKAYPHMINGENVLIIPSEYHHNCFMIDGTIRSDFHMYRLLLEYLKKREEQGLSNDLNEHEKEEYLYNKGYVFMDAYSIGNEHKLNQELKLKFADKKE